MPYIDITQAQAELDAEAEPVVLGIRGRDFTFPGAMPAAVEIEQMAIDRKTRQGEEVEGEERMMRAAFGEHYEALQDLCPSWELAGVLAALMREWMAPLADPKRMQARMERVHQKAVPLAQRRSSNGSSSTSSGPSRRTSSASTRSTLPEPSIGNGCRGAASSTSSGDSQARR